MKARKGKLGAFGVTVSKLNPVRIAAHSKCDVYLKRLHYRITES